MMDFRDFFRRKAIDTTMVSPLSSAMKVYYSRSFLRRIKHGLDLINPPKQFGPTMQKILRYEMGWKSVNFPCIKFYRYESLDVELREES